MLKISEFVRSDAQQKINHACVMFQIISKQNEQEKLKTTNCLVRNQMT